MSLGNSSPRALKSGGWLQFTKTTVRYKTDCRAFCLRVLPRIQIGSGTLKGRKIGKEATLFKSHLSISSLQHLWILAARGYPCCSGSGSRTPPERFDIPRPSALWKVCTGNEVEKNLAQHTWIQPLLLLCVSFNNLKLFSLWVFSCIHGWLNLP